MTNDTNTLNGALRELGETMAANLTTQGVASTWDEGLTTLAGKILDITPGPGPTPSFDGISLTGNKNILSAADSEYVTLEAQLTDSGSAAAVSGETVTFTVYKSSDDSVVTTLTDDTNSSGLATVSYYGQGTGDIYIQAECTFVSESFVVEDLLLYRTSVSSSDSFNVALPSHFEITSTVKKLASSGAYCYYMMDNFDAGSLRGNGSISVRKGNVTPFADKNTTIIQTNSPTTLKYEYNNGSHTISANGQSASGTNSDALGNFKSMTVTQYTVTDLKVKPL